MRTARSDGRSRAMLVLADVLALADAPALGADEVAPLLRADAGDAAAQADVGALFYVAGAYRAALYWLNEAAIQGNAEAMQWLGTAYACATVATSFPRTTTSPSCGRPRLPRTARRLPRSRWLLPGAAGAGA